MNLNHDLVVGINYKTNLIMHLQSFCKENLRYLVWTCRDPIFSDSRDLMMILSDDRDPILNSKDPNRVPEAP